MDRSYSALCLSGAVHTRSSHTSRLPKRLKSTHPTNNSELKAKASQKPHSGGIEKPGFLRLDLSSKQSRDAVRTFKQKKGATTHPYIEILCGLCARHEHSLCARDYHMGGCKRVNVRVTDHSSCAHG